MLQRILVILAVAGALAACNFNANVSHSDETLNAEADAAYEDLLASRDDALIARMSSESDPAQIRQMAPMLRQLVGHDEAPEPDFVAGTRITSTQGEFYRMEQTYSYPDKIVRLTAEFVQENGAWRLRGFHVNAEPTGQPIEVVEAPVPTQGS